MVQVPTCGCGGSGSSVATGTCDCRLVPLEHEKLVVGAVVVSLSPAAGTDLALIENIPRGSGAVRWTDTGAPPVGGAASGFGHFLLPGASFWYAGDFAGFQLVRDAGANAVMAITYYSYL